MTDVTRDAPRAPLPPADPDASLPPAIRRQAERSNAIQQAMLGDGATPAPSVVPSQSGTPPSPGAPVPPGTPQEPAPVTPGVTNGAQPPANGAQLAQDFTPEQWEQRFRSLEGRYHADMRRAADRTNQLERELTMRAQPPPAPPEVRSLLTQEEIDEYGPDFVDVVKRAATEAQAPLLGKIAQLEAQVGATDRMMQVGSNDRMHDHMNRALPGWQELNNHPEFIAWSRLPDVYSGVIRQVLMQDAWDRGDSHRVEAFFRGFIAEQSATGAAPASPAAVAPPAQPNGSPVLAPQPRVSLESLAAPGRARSAPPVPADKPVYTRAQITKFYADCATGRFRGTAEQRAAIDADIMQAQHEGRIIDNPMLAASPPSGFAR